MRGLVVDLARPYRRWLVIILLAMMVETATSLAGPWPLKIVIDNAVGRHAAPEWVVRLLGPAHAAVEEAEVQPREAQPCLAQHGFAHGEVAVAGQEPRAPAELDEGPVIEQVQVARGGLGAADDQDALHGPG